MHNQWSSTKLYFGHFQRFFNCQFWSGCHLKTISYKQVSWHHRTSLILAGVQVPPTQAYLHYTVSRYPEMVNGWLENKSKYICLLNGRRREWQWKWRHTHCACVCAPCAINIFLWTNRWEVTKTLYRRIFYTFDLTLPFYIKTAIIIINDKKEQTNKIFFYLLHTNFLVEFCTVKLVANAVRSLPHGQWRMTKKSESYTNSKLTT